MIPALANRVIFTKDFIGGNGADAWGHGTHVGALIAGRAQTEASGGVRLDTIRAIAESGVDFVSVGAVTHSARAVDLGLDFVP